MLMLRANTPRLTLAAVWTAGNALLQVAIDFNGADLRFPDPLGRSIARAFGTASRADHSMRFV